MPTLLVNPKMSPALAARVRASVAGRRTQHTSSRVRARRISWLRFCVAGGLVWLSAAIVLSIRHERAVLEHAKQALAARWSAESSFLRPEDTTFLQRVESAIKVLQMPYPGDFVAVELRSIEGLAKVLARTAVYFRAADTNLDGTPAAMARTAAESGKDTLLLCLMAPPPDRDEKTLLASARLALAGGVTLHRHTQTVLRLHDVEVGLPLLQRPWRERIGSARSELELQRLENELKRTSINLTKQALRSELLIAVIDEPNLPGTITELDGEAPHDIRLMITELDTDRLLLRVRKRVDPSWITPNRRPQYARELDGCRFALAVRETVREASAR